MNIFVLDKCPILAAQAQCNKHVVKMTLETAQLLSTCHHLKATRPSRKLYKPTHINHPCSVWLRQSTGNYDWLFAHWCALLEEYHFRYGGVHKPRELLGQLSRAPDTLVQGPMTPFALAMPDECKVGDAVESYRAYYRKYKQPLLQYQLRKKPQWLQ